MTGFASFLIADALKIALPILAEQIATFAAAKEPEAKAYLANKFGHGSPIVDEVFQLLIEPGLVTIGGLLTTIGSAAPASYPAAESAPHEPWPDYRDN